MSADLGVSASAMRAAAEAFVAAFRRLLDLGRRPTVHSKPKSAEHAAYHLREAVKDTRYLVVVPARVRHAIVRDARLDVRRELLRRYPELAR